MDCAEHRNNDMAHCPQCLAMYWKAQYEALKADMTQQQTGDSTDQLRFKSACEISGEKHPEYVRGYEAAMDAVYRGRSDE